jgi:prepilin-type N-terminal cleavage/methylation domain-containing protein
MINKQIKNKNRKKDSKNKGFTLLEILVVLVIFSIFTAIVMFNYSKFQGNIILSNMAYETALSLRESQTYGISVRKAAPGIPTDFTYQYGSQFSIGNSNEASNFKQFVDLDDNNKCDQSNSAINGSPIKCDCELVEGDECMSMMTYQRRIYIKKICAETNSSLLSDCINNPNQENEPVQEVSILFKRPNPDAKIFVKKDENWGSESQTNVAIVLASPNTEIKKAVIVLKNTGDNLLQ